MTTDLWTSRMHAVLDGTATAADTATLRAHLADDADATEEFAAWKAMFDGLADLPMAHPPEGLVAAIVAALPAPAAVPRAPTHEIFTGSHQLFQAVPVLQSGTARTTRTPLGFKSISSWLVPASSRESYMNKQQKFMAGGVAAVLAVGVAVVLLGFPPKSADVIGTVVPAERYRAAQTGSEAVKLGEPAGRAAATPGTPDNATAAQQNAVGQNLASQNLADQNLASQNLASQNLASQNLAGQNLSNQNRNQNLTSQNLADQNLANQDLKSQNLINQNMASQNRNQNLTSQNLADQNLTSQNLKSQNLTGQNLAGQNLASQNLASQNLNSQNLASQNLASQNLASQNLNSQNLASQNLKNQNLASQNRASQNLSNQNSRDYK